MGESAHWFAIVISFVPICMYTIGGLIIVVTWKDDCSEANSNFKRDAANRRVHIMLIVNCVAGLVYGLTLNAGWGLQVFRTGHKKTAMVHYFIDRSTHNRHCDLLGRCLGVDL